MQKPNDFRIKYRNNFDSDKYLSKRYSAAITVTGIGRCIQKRTAARSGGSPSSMRILLSEAGDGRGAGDFLVLETQPVVGAVFQSGGAGERHAKRIADVDPGPGGTAQAD